MRSIGHSQSGFFSPSILRRILVEYSAYGGLLIGVTTTALLAAGGIAYSGPCTAQIAELQDQINLTATGPTTGPSAPQSVGAQLHHQPTPNTVKQGENTANADADAALDRARKADSNGNADGCDEALREAKRLYGID